MQIKYWFHLRSYWDSLNRPNRSKHEIFSDILRAIETNELTISEIQNKTNITYQHLKRYLIDLVGHDLIFYKKEEKRFRITPRGCHVLDMYTRLYEMLVRNTSHSFIKSPEYFSSSIPWYILARFTNVEYSVPICVNQFYSFKHTIPIWCR